MNDESWMRVALEEAKKGLGLTAPNPVVGAVIVRDGEELARGWHKRAGEAHAECAAIEKVLSLGKAEQLKGATIYVTLEPCSTQGRTGACCDLLVSHGFARVVYGAIDPNPAHVGKGKEVLESAGVEVHQGILEQECKHLIRAFSKVQTKKQPWIIAKTAMTLDGRITRPPGEGQWLSNEDSRESVHELRCEVDAIVTSGKTVRNDNPRLTIRGREMPIGKQQPWRIVVSRSAEEEFAEDLHLRSDAVVDRTLFFQEPDLQTMLERLVSRDIHTVLVEAGGELLGAFQDQGLIDEYVVYLTPMVAAGPDVALGGLGVAGLEEAVDLKNVCYTRIGNDVMVRALVNVS